MPPASQQPPFRPPQISPVNSPQVQRDKQLSPRFQEPIHDMGSSLGYGQGMEYQYFDVPQPSQPIPMLRQTRLQQLREERMRRQQRRFGPDSTSIMNPRGPQDGSGSPAPHPLSSVGTPPLAPPASKLPSSPSLGMGGFPSAPPRSPLETSPVRESTSPPPTMQRSPLSPALPSRMPANPTAASTAQDTGMIQKVKMGRATMILSGAFIASRVLGLVRSVMFNFVFGAGPTSEAYLQAFLIPDMIFNIVAGGALSSAFIPVFSKYMTGDRDEKSAWHLANTALTLAIAIMTGLALVAIIFAGQIIPLLNPNTSGQQLNLIVSLTRIMLLQSVILGGGVIVNAVLNARQNFKLPAIGTVLYNIGMIAGLVPGIVMAFLGHRDYNFAVYAATFGVILGALLQVGIQIPGLPKVGMHFRPSFDWKNPGVIQVGRQMIPRVLNAAMLSLSTVVDRSLILLLAVVVGDKVAQGFVPQYYNAFQLMLLPLGIFGMAVSTAAFPTIADYVARGRMERVRNIILETLRGIIFMALPSSIGLIILALPIVQGLFQHGAFTYLDAQNTSFTLIFFAIGLTGHSAVEILTRAFYAMRDSRTPVIVSIAQFILKIALSLILIESAVWGAKWGLAALALSTSIAGLAEACTLFYLLNQRMGGLQTRSLLKYIGQIAVAGGIMGVALLVVRFVLDFALNTATDHLQGLGTFETLFKLIVELFIGLVVYIRVARMLGIENVEQQLGPIRRILNRFKLSWI